MSSPARQPEQTDEREDGQLVDTTLPSKEAQGVKDLPEKAAEVEEVSQDATTSAETPRRPH